jgi:hypothetical protein
MNYHIVAKQNVITFFKNSKLFKRDLGQTIYKVEDNGDRKINLSGFNKQYYIKKNHYLLKEGNIGVIMFYSNPYMIDDVISVYDDSFNELNLVYDFNYMNSITTNSYLGEVMKEFNKKYYPKTVDDFITEKGNADKLINEPWNVKWEDIQEYFNKKKQF